MGGVWCHGACMNKERCFTTNCQSPSSYNDSTTPNPHSLICCRYPHPIHAVKIIILAGKVFHSHCQNHHSHCQNHLSTILPISLHPQTYCIFSNSLPVKIASYCHEWPQRTHRHPSTLHMGLWSRLIGEYVVTVFDKIWIYVYIIFVGNKKNNTINIYYLCFVY